MTGHDFKNIWDMKTIFFLYVYPRFGKTDRDPSALEKGEDVPQIQAKPTENEPDVEAASRSSVQIDALSEGTPEIVEARRKENRELKRKQNYEQRLYYQGFSRFTDPYPEFSTLEGTYLVYLENELVLFASALKSKRGLKPTMTMERLGELLHRHGEFPGFF